MSDRSSDAAGDRPPPVPADQLPVDQQPVQGRDARRADGAPLVSPLPPGIPPLETTAPDELVASTSADTWQTGRLGVSSLDQPVMPDEPAFAPLRIDPPPDLAATWWLRWAAFVTSAIAIALTMLAEYSDLTGDLFVFAPVALTHVVIVVVQLVWSVQAIRNADALIPPTRYQRRSRPWHVAALWLLAAAAPVAAVACSRVMADRLQEPSDTAALVIVVGVTALAFLIGWLPFRAHARQASRIGAPQRPMAAWFWLPLAAFVGGVVLLAVGLDERLRGDGKDAFDDVVRLGVLYGLPMSLYAWSAWRATTVFDEVIDLRWQRWKSEWEQTLFEMAALPAPGPEGSPGSDRSPRR